MKNLYTSLILFFILFNVSKSQIPNGDFTNWHVDSLGRMDPDLWDCSNLMFDTATVIQDVDRLGGPGYSIRFNCIYDSSTSQYQGGVITMNNVPYSGINPTTIRGFWRTYNPSSDFIIGEFIFYDSTHTQVSHMSVQAPLTGSLLNWTSFTEVINYTSNNSVKSIDIQFGIYNFSGTPNIYAILDDLTFDDFTDVKELNSQSESLKCNIYSLDNEYRLVVSNGTQDKISVSIKDVFGRTISEWVKENYNSSEQEYNLNMSSLPKGLYFCCVNTSSAKKVIKILK
jgi:hypothetical protein